MAFELARLREGTSSCSQRASFPRSLAGFPQEPASLSDSSLPSRGLGNPAELHIACYVDSHDSTHFFPAASKDVGNY